LIGSASGIQSFDHFVSALFSGAPSDSHTAGHGPTSYPAELDDLYFLYGVVRRSCAVSVLEFGSGWSTLAIALAICENRAAMSGSYSARHPNPFKVLSIEADVDWAATTTARLQGCVREVAKVHLSAVRISKWAGQS